MSRHNYKPTTAAERQAFTREAPRRTSIYPSTAGANHGHCRACGHHGLFWITEDDGVSSPRNFLVYRDGKPHICQAMRDTWTAAAQVKRKQRAGEHAR